MTLKEYKNNRMKDPGFAQAYEEMQPEMNVIRAIIDARISQNMTQKELAEKTGIAQTEISRLNIPGSGYHQSAIGYRQTGL